MSTALRVAPVLPDRSDAQLVEAVRRGDDSAFAELYSRYCRRIGAYVRGMVGDHGRAEDITQEIFIAALRRMRDTVQPIAFKAWIYEIAKNACIDNFRRTRRAQEVSLDAHEDLSIADRGRLMAVTTLDSAIANKQAIDDLRGAFAGLSESHHEILVLRELEGRSYNDIGERLGMSRAVVESTLFRARRRLAEEYGELTSGRRCELVRKLVDSGPHYSLGIRDRRRMARHFAHCQACRAHARLAGLDGSILGVPGAGARIAALVALPMLRGRWGALEHDVIGAPPGRRSILAFRWIHTLARSSDQVAGAGVGAGRAGATAAALVLAGVGGGVATVTASQPGKPFNQSGVHRAAYIPRAVALAAAGVSAYGLSATVAGREVHVTSRVVPTPVAPKPGRARTGSTSVATRAPTSTRTAPNGSAPARSGTRAAPDGATRSVGTGAAGQGDPKASGGGGTRGAGSPTDSDPGAAMGQTGTQAGGDPAGAGTGTGTGGSPTGVSPPPVVGALPAGGLPPGSISTTLATIAGQLSALAGAHGGTGG